MKKALPVLVVIFFSSMMATCSDYETVPCFDKQLYENHKDDICTQDCPGVRGCDGKVYCNECVANAQGIRVEN